jgi:hypothetical protein
VSRRLPRIAALACCAALLLGYVLPADRVIEEMARQRARRPALRVDAVLETDDAAWPGRVRIDLHPELGARVEDDAGGRWLLLADSARSTSPDAAWLPAPELLVLQQERQILRRLRRAGVDVLLNELGRCGDADCFVIGGRAGGAQLWVDKDSFDVWRFRAADGRVIHFEEYADWDGLRFPSRMRIQDSLGPLGIIRVERVRRASNLGRGDFSPRWLESPASPEGPD